MFITLKKLFMGLALTHGDFIVILALWVFSYVGFLALTHVV